jgi:hypothetical protein
VCLSLFALIVRGPISIIGIVDAKAVFVCSGKLYMCTHIYIHVTIMKVQLVQQQLDMAGFVACCTVTCALGCAWVASWLTYQSLFG